MVEKRYFKKLIANEIVREINVYVGSVLESDHHYDLVWVSAFKDNYEPVNGSFIQNLFYKGGVNVKELAKYPDKNGKDFGFWISKRIEGKFFDRLCCFEFMPFRIYGEEISFREIFDHFITMLKYDNQYRFKNIATPILFTKNVGLTQKQVIPVMLNTALECFSNNNELTEFSIYCLSEEDASKVNEVLNNILDKPYDIFISYPHAKTEKMIEINKLLESYNIITWNDKKYLKGGDIFDEVITDAIDKSKVFLVLWYKQTEESSYCLKELDYALDLNKVIVPYRCSKELDGSTVLGKKIGRISWISADEYDENALLDNIQAVLKDIKSNNGNIKEI